MPASACIAAPQARDNLAGNNLAGAAEKDVKEDCFWSAFNFFNDVPDNRVEDTHTLAGLDRYYDPISVPNQLGDVLILTAHDGVPVHAAVFLADNVTSRRTGPNRAQPWILMRLADVLETYHFQHSGQRPCGGSLLPPQGDVNRAAGNRRPRPACQSGKSG